MFTTIAKTISIAFIFLFLISIIIFKQKTKPNIKKLFLLIISIVSSINLVVYDIYHLSNMNFNIIQYHPTEYFEAYTLGGLVFIVNIVMFLIAFTNKDKYKNFFFYIILPIAFLSFIINGKDVTNSETIFFNLSGFKYGLLSNVDSIFYLIKNTTYLLFGITMIVFNFFKPQFKDLLMTLSIIIITIFTASIYNMFINKIHANINIYGSFYNIRHFYSNLLLVSNPSNFPLLELIYKLPFSGLLFPVVIGLLWLLFSILITFIFSIKNLSKELSIARSYIKNYFADLKKKNQFYLYKEKDIWLDL